MDVASLDAGSEGYLVVGTADLDVDRQAFSNRMYYACYWDPSCCQTCSAKPGRLGKILVRTPEPDRMCRTGYEVEDSEVRCRDVRMGSFRSVGVSQDLDSFGAGLRRHLPPMDTRGLLVSLIWSWTLCPEGCCRIRHASDG
jgi:hypothetical protein